MKKTRTRIGSILLALTLVLTLLPVTALAVEQVDYLDKDGTLIYTSSEINVTEINTENAPKKWVNGWYVVSGKGKILEALSQPAERARFAVCPLPRSFLLHPCAEPARTPLPPCGDV